MKKIYFLVFILCSLAMDAQDNLVANPSFENWDSFVDNPDNWSRWLDGSWSQSTDATDQNHSLALETACNSGCSLKFNFAFSSDITLEDSTPYKISVDYKVLNGTFTKLDLEVRRSIFDIDEFSTTDITNEWKTFEIEYTPSANETINFYIQAFSQNEHETILIDNVKIVKKMIQKDALIALYNATDGPNWTRTWDLDAPMSTWYGITVDPSGNVTDVSLSHNRLKNALPDEIGDLTELKALRLGGNQLEGTIPSAIGNSTTLEILSLSNNKFTGNIPKEIGNLVSLERLFLDTNQLSGTIPAELQNFTGFVLDIKNNNFVFKDFEANPNVLQITALKYDPQNEVNDSAFIDLEIGEQITFSVTGTDSPNNNYQWKKNGEIINGATLANLTLTNLTQADRGSYTCEITNPNAPELTLERNPITLISPTPSNERDALIALYQATDGPNWNHTWDLNAHIGTWHGVTINEAGSVTELSLQHNKLKGIIPNRISDFIHLEKLEFNNNELIGNIPSEIGNLTNLTYVNLGHNELDGTTSFIIKNLTKLTYLYLADNQLTGTIPPEIGNLIHLDRLFLGRNQLTGTIPSEIGNLTNLTFLSLDWNQLTGVIPVEIMNLTKLSFLHLGANQLTGTIPSEIGNLINISFLSLDQNQLTGIIPVEIINLTKLSYLYLRDNQLTGTIPSEIGNLTNLAWLFLERNQLTGSIPSEIGNLIHLSVLYVSENKLSGVIPSEIKNLTNLYDFQIQKNQFVFEDLEADFTALQEKGFVYSPQDLVDDIQTYQINEQESILFSVDETISVNNNYQWRFNGANINGATARTHTINNANSSHIGTYDCVITNSIITDLVIERKPITLQVQVIDEDNDGISDSIDLCTDTDKGVEVNNNGCAQNQLDDDNDGVTNDIDQCPSTDANAIVDDNGCAQNQLDDDNDGITNDIDQCPSTDNGGIVDTNGCSTEQSNNINPTDIQVTTNSISCPEVNNGSITVSFTNDHSYIVSLKGETENRSFDDIDFNTGLEITDLSIGTYEVCITASDLTSFEQCYTTVITAPENLLVSKSKQKGKSITYQVSGSKHYKVAVNTKEYEYKFKDTKAQEIKINLEEGSNTIKIKTDKACQGVYNKTIMKNAIMMYPVPAEEHLNITGINENNATISISNLAGSIVQITNITIENGVAKLPMTTIPTGIYLITISTTTQTINTKIFKQ